MKIQVFTTLTAVVILGALVLGAAVTRGHAATSGATGNGDFTATAGTRKNPVLVDVSTQFTANIDNSGELEQKSSDPSLDFHGDITCFQKLSPTEAVFGGIITSPDSPLVGEFFEVLVVDNSENGTPPDQYGIVISRRQPDCKKVKVTLHDLTQGNLQVH